MRFAILALVPLNILALGAARTKTDAEKIQGTWQVERFTQDGKDMEVPPGMTAVIQDNTFQVKQEKLAEPKAILKFKDSNKLKEVDFVNEMGQVVHAGIYVIEGDHLKFCYSTKGQRPDKFASESDSGVRLLVLKRVAK